MESGYLETKIWVLGIIIATIPKFYHILSLCLSVFILCLSMYINQHMYTYFCIYFPNCLYWHQRVSLIPSFSIHFILFSFRICHYILQQWGNWLPLSSIYLFIAPVLPVCSPFLIVTVPSTQWPFTDTHLLSCTDFWTETLALKKNYIHHIFLFLESLFKKSLKKSVCVCI